MATPVQEPNPYEAPKIGGGQRATRGHLSRWLRIEVRWYVAMALIPSGVFCVHFGLGLALYAYLHYMVGPVLLR